MGIKLNGLISKRKIIISVMFFALLVVILGASANQRVLAAGSCSYQGETPTEVSKVNVKPKCVTLKDGSSDLYLLKYNFSVTGISNVGK